MVLSFKEQFKQPILEGIKIHTLREDPKNRWHAGRNIQMATGVRSKKYACFRADDCLSTQILYFMYNPESNHLTVSLEGGAPFTDVVKHQLAINDGFPDYEAFVDWFAPILLKEPFFSKEFKLIHWTDFKY